MRQHKSIRPDWKKQGKCPKCGVQTELTGQFAGGRVKLGCGHWPIGMEWELQGNPPREIGELATRLERVLKQGGMKLGLELRQSLWALQNLEDYGKGPVYAAMSRDEWLGVLDRAWPKGHGLMGTDKRAKAYLLRQEINWRLKWERD